jgi:hypothetical protein
MVKRGFMRIWNPESFTWDSFVRCIDYVEKDGKINFLISDGIILTREHLNSLRDSEVFIQRILTSYQFIRILREQQMEKVIIFIISRVSDEWDLLMVESILELLRIKSSIHGSKIILNVIGGPGKLKYYMKPIELAMVGINPAEAPIWEDQQLRQGRL